MKTAPALALIAVGAILAFAVHAHLRLFSFQIAGWVLMLTGIAGLVIPGRGYSWVRRVTLWVPKMPSPHTTCEYSWGSRTAAAGPAIRTAGRRSDRADEVTRPIIMPCG